MMSEASSSSLMSGDGVLRAATVLCERAGHPGNRSEIISIISIINRETNLRDLLAVCKKVAGKDGEDFTVRDYVTARDMARSVIAAYEGTL